MNPFNSVPAVLARGSTGPAVRELQAKLAALGLQLNVDGSFNIETENALRQFQAAEGLDANGTLNPETEGRLNQRIITAQQNMQSTATGTGAPSSLPSFFTGRPVWQLGLMALGGIAIVGGIFYALGLWDDADMEKMEERHRRSLARETVDHDSATPVRYRKSVRAHGSSLRGSSQKCARSPDEADFKNGEGVTV